MSTFIYYMNINKFNKTNQYNVDFTTSRAGFGKAKFS